jgi:hypothetical protein
MGCARAATGPGHMSLPPLSSSAMRFKGSKKGRQRFQVRNVTYT